AIARPSTTWSAPWSAAESGGQQRFQLFLISRKQPDALGQLLGSHGVLVKRPAEIRLFQMHARLADGTRLQHALEFAVLLVELLKQVGADGQAVAAGQLFDLAEVAEARTHHHGLVAVRLVVLVNARHRAHARIFAAAEVAALVLLVPVVDAPDEGRDQEAAGLGA